MVHTVSINHIKESVKELTTSTKTLSWNINNQILTGPAVNFWLYFIICDVFLDHVPSLSNNSQILLDANVHLASFHVSRLHVYQILYLWDASKPKFQARMSRMVIMAWSEWWFHEAEASTQLNFTKGWIWWWHRVAKNRTQASIQSPWNNF